MVRFPQQAYLRWSLQRGKRTHRGSRSLGLLAVAALFAAGGALGITGIIRPSMQPGLDVSSTTPARASRTIRGTSNRPTAGKQVPSLPIPDGSAMSPNPRIPEASMLPAHPPSHEASATSPSIPEAVMPDNHQIPLTPSSKPAAQRIAPDPVLRAVRAIRPTTMPTPTTSTTTQRPEPAEPGCWTPVAQAMREDDPVRVNTALELLRQTGNAETRDAARLARAQLEIANGNSELVRVELHELAETGATPMVRRRAKDMLRRLSQ